MARTSRQRAFFCYLIEKKHYLQSTSQRPSNLPLSWHWAKWNEAHMSFNSLLLSLLGKLNSLKPLVLATSQTSYPSEKCLFPSEKCLGNASLTNCEARMYFWRMTTSRQGRDLWTTRSWSVLWTDWTRCSTNMRVPMDTNLSSWMLSVRQPFIASSAPLK